MIIEFPNGKSVPLDGADTGGALRKLEHLLRDDCKHFVLFPDAWNMYNAARDERLRQIYSQASAVFPDGISWLLLARLQGHRLPERIPGPAFLGAACQYGLRLGWKHFFYGGAPGVGNRLAETLTQRFPGLKVAGAFSPPFRPLTDTEEAEVKNLIEASGAQLLWVALGAPKQEYWMAQHLGTINVPVMLGVGAAFDFHSGNRPRAPRWVRALCLEWAYRTVTGGRATFFRNIKCVSCVARLLMTTAVLQAARHFRSPRHTSSIP
jgi:N-acetylglucosaminyldiphosphoundecaprenol N-acetyl-beta-D-mannosaminyltransferase